MRASQQSNKGHQQADCGCRSARLPPQAEEVGDTQEEAGREHTAQEEPVSERWVQEGGERGKGSAA
eukprot:1680441-Rhodomonas_salina.3